MNNICDLKVALNMTSLCFVAKQNVHVVEPCFVFLNCMLILICVVLTFHLCTFKINIFFRFSVVPIHGDKSQRDRDMALIGKHVLLFIFLQLVCFGMSFLHYFYMAVI